jgi:tetratricopeptide (TPR) repeat protein
MSHLSEDEVERFLAARLGPAEQKRVVRHLLAGCGLCSRKLVEQAPERLLEQAARQYRKAAQDSPRERTLAAALEQDARWRLDEKKLARSLELLRGSPGGYDGLTFRQVRSLHGVPLIEALLERSFELRYSDPKAMRWLAFNAVKAAESLRPQDYAPHFRFNLQARSWAELANAYRINEEYGEAEGAFGRARALLRQGSGDFRLLARLATLEAEFRNAQRRLAEARELREGVYRLYHKLDERQLTGRTLISMGCGTEYEEDRSRQHGIQLLRKGLFLLDPNQEPQLVSVGQQCLITLLTLSGEHQEAGTLLLKSGLRQSFADSPLNLLKLRWLEGRISAGFGRLSSAHRAFLEVRAGFLDSGKAYTAALVGFDLLHLLVRQGKYGEVRGVARELYGTFREMGIGQEAAKAQTYLG